MTSTACSRISIGMAAATLCFVLAPTVHLQKYIKGERSQQRGYSLAVITDGGMRVGARLLGVFQPALCVPAQ